MSFADGAIKSLKNNRADLKRRKDKFRFRKMLPKSSQRSKSLNGFIQAKLEYSKKLKKDELNHWKRVVGLSLVVFSLLFILFKYVL